MTSRNRTMSSYCHICGNFVNNLDDCELPYGGAPAPNYEEFYECENLDVLENPYYVPPLLPDNFQIFSRECPPAKTTRSNTLKFRSGELSRKVRSLLDEVTATEGVVNKLTIVDIIYMIFKDNMDVLKNNTILYNVSKQKLNAIIDEYPEAQYLKAIRYQLFTV